MVTRVLLRPGVLKLYHIQNQGSACQPRPLNLVFNNLKYAALHMDVVHPISDGKNTPGHRNQNTDPISAGQCALPKHCTAFYFFFFLVLGGLSLVTAPVLLPSSERVFQWGFERSFSRRVKLCYAVSLS